MVPAKRANLTDSVVNVQLLDGVLVVRDLQELVQIHVVQAGLPRHGCNRFAAGGKNENPSKPTPNSRTSPHNLRRVTLQAGHGKCPASTLPGRRIFRVKYWIPGATAEQTDRGSRNRKKYLSQ